MAIDLSEVSEWPAEKLRAWLASRPVDPDFNWELLESMVGNAARTAGVEIDRADALGEVAYYALQQKLAAHPDWKRSITTSEVHLRAWMIVVHGHEPGTLRDSEELLGIISAELSAADPLRHHIADGPIESLGDVPIEEIARLRHVKNVLGVAARFLKELGDEPPQPIAWWSTRRSDLP